MLGQEFANRIIFSQLGKELGASEIWTPQRRPWKDKFDFRKGNNAVGRLEKQRQHNIKYIVIHDLL